MADRETNLRNAFETTVSSDVGTTDLTFNVTTTTGLTSPCYLVVDPDDDAKREVVYFDGSFTGTTLVTSASGNRYLTGSAAASGITHTAGAKVRMAPLQQHFEDLNDRVDAQIPKSLIDAAGDIIYGSAADTPARLAPGTARQQLAMNSGATAPEWVASLQSLMSAQGDIVYASAANTPARLAKGTAGQVLKMNSGATAPEWGAASVPVRKSINEAITSNTPLQDDDELLFAVAANEVWVALFFVYYTTPTAADIKFAITGPSGSSGRITALAPSASVGSGSYNDYQGDSAGLGGTLTRGGSGTAGAADTAILAVTIENGATAGNVQLQWAQSVSNATATTVYEHSFLIPFKVA